MPDQTWDTVVQQIRDMPDWCRGVEEDEFTEPTRAAIETAKAVARSLEAAGVEPPQHVVPDANGGIDLEWRAGRCEYTIVIWDDGTAEEVVFVDATLVHRRRYNPAKNEEARDA